MRHHLSPRLRRPTRPYPSSMTFTMLAIAKAKENAR